MSRLAIAGVGAAIGIGIALIATGGAAGFPLLAAAGSLGFSVGMFAGNYLFPDKVKQEGARLNDLAVTSSAFGAIRPLLYGRARIGGNIIWATPIRETKHTQHHGGKGGPSVTSTTYTYSASYAVALCEGPIAQVLRIWADSKLIYDSSAKAGNVTVGPGDPLSMQYQSTTKSGVNFRYYTGSEDQLPDSLIQADKGAENVPAYRGTAYLVFDDLQLADYGNRLPNITAEVVEKLAPSFPVQEWTERAPDTIFGPDSYGHKGLAIDWNRNLAYWQGQNPNGIIVADASTLRTLREVAMTDVLLDRTDGGNVNWNNATPNGYVGPDGALYFLVSGRNVRVDTNTLKETASFPTGTWVDFSTEHFGQPTNYGGISCFLATGERANWLIVANLFTQWGALSLPDMAYAGHGGVAAVAPCQGIVQGNVGVGVGDCWILWGPGLIGGPNMYIHRIQVDGFGTFTHTVFPIPVAAINPDPTMHIFAPAEYHLFNWDPADNGLIFTCTTRPDVGSPGPCFIAKWTEHSGIVWVTGIPNTASSSVNENARLTGGTVGLNAFNHFTIFSTATGAVVYDGTTSATPGAGWNVSTLNSVQLYDSETQILAAYYNSPGVPGGFAKAYLNRGAASSATLGHIVADQCARAGFVTADYDVSALTDEVQGFVISQRASVADVLAPLLGGYYVDAVETDWMIKFRHRGGGVVATIPQDKLIRQSDQQAEPYLETRQQEIELPMRVTITYADKDRDYQQSTAIAKRIRNPDPTVFTDNQVDLQLAAVMTSTPAKQMAERILYTTWNERHVFTTRFSPEYDYLDPADVVQLTLDDGYTARVRLGNTSMGVDYSLEAKLVAETEGQYVSNAEADPGVPWIGSHFIIAAGKSELIMLDTPLLRDVDDMAGRAVRGYWAGGSFSRISTWPGAVLQASPTTSSWFNVGSVTNEGTWGYIEIPPTDWEPVFATQDEIHGGVIKIGIIGGSFIPSSVTDEDMANGANAIALIKTNGQVEVVQYRDAAALGDGRWQLSTLRRGARGTDTMAFGHDDGEIIVFLDESLIDVLEVPLSQRNVSEFYRLVTVGQYPDNAMTESFTYHGRDQMPYAPVNARRTLVATNVIITWTRRTRIGGWMADGTDDVPLHETSEAYEAYLLRNEGDAVNFDPNNPTTYMRAFTGLTTPSLTYTAVMMAADGINPMVDTLYAAIYQLSGVVGRGFSSLHVLPPLGGLGVSLEDGSGEWSGWTWG